jgi:2-polyprenyl-3-methyl-5-hydroxy-6-metoxy-1,4-benzoquinol methylase
MADDDERDVVRRGYDALSYHYRRDDADDGEYAPWLAELSGQLPPGARVLDVGCGCGVPVARFLDRAGHRVTGVDISEVQIERARRLVPAATFIRADAVDLRLAPATFDAVVCLYTVIHVPLALQPDLLRTFGTWLRPQGRLLLTTGQHAWTGTEDNWLNGPATMWWSHADAATYHSWLEQAGFEIVAEEFVPEGTSGHALFRARRRSNPAGVPGR